MYLSEMCLYRVVVRVLCSALFLSAAWLPAGQGPVEAPPAPGTLVDVGGYRVHLYCTGTGTPTVMIVGAAFSFDWGLVQPEVAKSTHVCTFDPSGTAWSDPFATAVRTLEPGKNPHAEPTCEDRVAELRRLIVKAPVEGPYILVGFSVGALWERLYALQYPQDVLA